MKIHFREIDPYERVNGLLGLDFLRSVGIIIDLVDMKIVFIVITGFISLVCLAGCNNNHKHNFYGTYTFEKVSN